MGINQVPPVVATPEVVSYATPGTYTFTPPAGTSEGNPAYARVVVTGAGGGGGAQTVGRSGAGGSAGQQIILPSVKITGNTSITVGAGGAGATTAGATATAGGSSTFGSYTAAGGAGAIAGTQGAAPALMPASSRGATGVDGARFVVFAATGATNQIRYSADAVNWTVTGGFSNSPYCVFANNGRILANTFIGSNQYQINWSSDGSNWNSVNQSSTNLEVEHFAASGNTIAAACTAPSSGGGTANYMFSTNNGDSWTTASLPVNIPWGVVLTNGSTWVFAQQSSGANNVRSNTTLGGASGGWVARSVGSSSNTWYGGAFGNGRFVLTSYEGSIFSSTDGATWTSRATGQGSLFRTVYTGSLFFTRDTGSNSTSYLYSSNGESWSSGNLPAGSASSGSWLFGFVGGNYYCLTNNGRMHSSSDGINWTFLATLDSTLVTNGIAGAIAPMPYVSLGTVSGNQPTAVATYVGDLVPTGGASGNSTSTTGSGGGGGTYTGASVAASTGAAAATVGQVPGAGGGGGGTGSTAGAAGANGLVAIYL
jgi:hypothetical protein